MATGEEVFLGRDIARDRNYSEAIAYAIDQEAREFVEECYDKARNILVKYAEKLHEVARRLMENEIMEANEFEAIMGG